jgi:hypothetical protein
MMPCGVDALFLSLFFSSAGRKGVGGYWSGSTTAVGTAAPQ